MSSKKPVVKIGFGFILDKDESFHRKMNSVFPERVRSVKQGFAPESIRSCFSRRYRDLQVDELTDPSGVSSQIVVYSYDRSQELVGEGMGAKVAGAIYPEDVTLSDAKDFQKFMDEFGINHPPKIVVWTLWQ
jgi:hypothetical protein